VQHDARGGISGTVDGRKVALGSWAWLTQHLNMQQSQPEDPPRSESPLQRSVPGLESQQMQVSCGDWMMCVIAHNIPRKRH
jgi:hypothetical protein